MVKAPGTSREKQRRQSVYVEAGGLDEGHLKIAFNDIDLCLPILEKGYGNVMERAFSWRVNRLALEGTTS